MDNRALFQELISSTLAPKPVPVLRKQAKRHMRKTKSVARDVADEADTRYTDAGQVALKDGLVMPDVENSDDQLTEFVEVCRLPRA